MARKAETLETLTDVELVQELGLTYGVNSRFKRLRAEAMARGWDDGETRENGRYAVRLDPMEWKWFNHSVCELLLGEEAYTQLWEKRPTRKVVVRQKKAT